MCIFYIPARSLKLEYDLIGSPKKLIQLHKSQLPWPLTAVVLRNLSFMEDLRTALEAELALCLLVVPKGLPTAKRVLIAPIAANAKCNIQKYASKYAHGYAYYEMQKAYLNLKSTTAACCIDGSRKQERTCDEVERRANDFSRSA